MTTSTTVPASSEAASPDDGLTAIFADLNAIAEEYRIREATRDLDAPEAIDAAQIEELLSGLDEDDRDATKLEVVEARPNPDVEADVVAVLDAVDYAGTSPRPDPSAEDEFATLTTPVTKVEVTPVDDIQADDFEAMPLHRIDNPRAGRGVRARAAGITDGIVVGGIMVEGRRYEWARKLAGQNDKNTAEGALGINRRTFDRKIKEGVPFAAALAQSQEASRRYARTVEFAGREMRLSDFAEAVGLSLRTVQLYTKQGMSGDEIEKREKKKPGPKKT